MTQKSNPVPSFPSQSLEPVLTVSDLLNSIPVGIIVIDLDGVILHSNKEAADHTGLPIHKFIGYNILSFWPTSGNEIISAMSSGHQSIGLVPVEIDNCYIQVKSLSGKVKGSTITIFDQRLWQSYLHSNHPLDPLAPYYKQIFERSIDGLSIVDSKERIILMNDASASQMGLTREDVQGRTISYLIENRFNSDNISRDVIATGKPITRLIQNYKTGKQLLLTGNPIFTPDGEVHLVLVNERDLTELLKLQSSLQLKKVTVNHNDKEPQISNLFENSSKNIVAKSPTMINIMEQASKLANCNSPQLLLTGETGTGKNLIAKFIHSLSPRCNKPLININCASLSEQLLEAELFGYERGTFPDSQQNRAIGLFEVAKEGTIYLDEIGEMPLNLQAKILTFLDTRSFRRMHGHEVLKSDVTIIASTNNDLKELITRRLFRSDLYFRLTVFTLNLPPLRNRSEDIIEITLREIEKLNNRYEENKKIDQKGKDILVSHGYPGNVRELINLVHQAYIHSEGSYIDDSLQIFLPKSSSLENQEKINKMTFFNKMANTEKELLIKTVSLCKNTREMATLLGISQAGVSRKLKKFGIPLPKYYNIKSSDDEDVDDDTYEELT
jgi:PAS domain S-box-containing protein